MDLDSATLDLILGLTDWGPDYEPGTDAQAAFITAGTDWKTEAKKILADFSQTIPGKMAIDRLCLHQSTGDLYAYRHGRWILTSRQALPKLYPGKNGDRLEALAGRPVVESIAYNPCKGPLFRTKGLHLNMFRYNPIEPAKPSPEDAAKVADLVLALAGEDQAGADYILDWMARPFQAFLAKDESRIQNMTALLFIGPEGTGKSTLFNLWSACFMADLDEGEQPPWLILSTDNLKDDKTPDLHRCIAVCGNEIRAENDVDLANKLKTYITDTWIPLRRMKEAATSYRNWGNWFFCSNHHFPLHIGETDRRFSVFKGKRVADHILELSPQKTRQKWASYLAYMLAHRSLQANVTKPFDTEWRRLLMEAGKSPAAMFAQKLKEEGLNSLWLEIPPSARGVILDDPNARISYDSTESKWISPVLPRQTLTAIFIAWALAKNIPVKGNRDMAARDILVEAERAGLAIKAHDRSPLKERRFRNAVAGIPLDA